MARTSTARRALHREGLGRYRRPTDYGRHPGLAPGRVRIARDELLTIGPCVLHLEMASTEAWHAGLSVRAQQEDARLWLLERLPTKEDRRAFLDAVSRLPAFITAMLGAADREESSKAEQAKDPKVVADRGLGKDDNRGGDGQAAR